MKDTRSWASAMADGRVLQVVTCDSAWEEAVHVVGSLAKLVPCLGFFLSGLSVPTAHGIQNF